jgi:hypothetical protein
MWALSRLFCNIFIGEAEKWKIGILAICDFYRNGMTIQSRISALQGKGADFS